MAMAAVEEEGVASDRGEEQREADLASPEIPKCWRRWRRQRNHRDARGPVGLWERRDDEDVPGTSADEEQLNRARRKDR
uniref:Uncharacterized protein n=1 Tax=Oryza sativa subsp. japonica TaxID=39947 RepID=Q6H4D8_ORYSJ|nr:hypothetical protein [Oryza sativa Japonica Group]BAD26411.1 hypothetical protein [Oryza sativa Japonica Group]